MCVDVRVKKKKGASDETKCKTLRRCVHCREAGLLCLLDLAPVLVKQSDTKSWDQIFIT